jgi:hypothetical protein
MDIRKAAKIVEFMDPGLVANMMPYVGNERSARLLEIVDFKQVVMILDRVAGTYCSHVFIVGCVFESLRSVLCKVLSIKGYCRPLAKCTLHGALAVEQRIPTGSACGCRQGHGIERDDTGWHGAKLGGGGAGGNGALCCRQHPEGHASGESGPNPRAGVTSAFIRSSVHSPYVQSIRLARSQHACLQGM